MCLTTVDVDRPLHDYSLMCCCVVTLVVSCIQSGSAAGVAGNYPSRVNFCGARLATRVGRSGGSQAVEFQVRGAGSSCQIIILGGGLIVPRPGPVAVQTLVIE